MASTKVSAAKDSKAKKRKRDTNESDAKSKRHRQQDGRSNSQPGGGFHRSDDDEAGWRVSKPMGGRILDIDPILSEDEQYLIVAYNTSLQIFNAADSLLVRRIPIGAPDASLSKGTRPAQIVATRLSKQNPGLVWVACSDGHVYRVDWSESICPSPAFQTESETAKALVVIPASFAESKEILLIAESKHLSHMKIVAYELNGGNKAEAEAKAKNMIAFEKEGNGLQILEATRDGQVLVGAFKDKLFLGTASKMPSNLDELRYNFFSFDAPDLITCIDLRVRRSSAGWNAKQHKSDSDADVDVDVVVGGARGGIYVYRNAAAPHASGKLLTDGVSAQKYHWHRKAVHAVKWSKDGNYLISGGSENVLVLWQIDTSKQDFLPHLSGSIENIVVSPKGSSYVIHLDDNSVMILSTAEMKPTAYIAGLQSAAMETTESKDLLVRRAWKVAGHVRRPIPAVISPSEPSKLHVCVGNGRQATMSGEFSAPMLQIFDLESFTSVSKQALARTQPTDVNLTSKGQAIDEPFVTNIAFSGDGRWLASIDEWRPADGDVENIIADMRDQFIRERREVYLKFWEVRNGTESMALTSRINSPHGTKCPETVLDLASDPTSSSFVTLGADGVARLWRPRARQHHGIPVKDENGRNAVSWICAQVMAIGEGAALNDGTDVMSHTEPIEVQGKTAFSEDGSTLFVAFGNLNSEGLVYVIDVASGMVVKTLEGLWEGQLQSIRALSSYVIVLSSKDLRVYDVVGDELQYGIIMPKTASDSKLLHLAVDFTSGRFAVSIPSGDVSSIGVFAPEHPEPLLVRTTPHAIVSLLSAPATSGFIALDDAAQVWVIGQSSEPSSLATAQPLQDLQLDGNAEPLNAPAAKDLVNEDGDENDSEVDKDVDMGIPDEKGGSGDGDDDDGDDGDDFEDEAQISTIPHQFLAEIFDAAPAFAAPSIEDMFYKVTGLLATKSSAAS